jgi:hypothetical protein
MGKAIDENPNGRHNVAAKHPGIEDEMTRPIQGWPTCITFPSRAML